MPKGPQSKSGHVRTLKSMSERLKEPPSETWIVRPHHIGAEHAETKSGKTWTRETTQEVRASLVSVKTLVSAIAREKIADFQHIGQEAKTLSRQENMKNGHLKDDIISGWVLVLGPGHAKGAGSIIDEFQQGKQGKPGRSSDGILELSHN